MSCSQNALKGVEKEVILSWKSRKPQPDFCTNPELQVQLHLLS